MTAPGPVSLHPVSVKEKEVLRELLEKYLCEFSRYTGEDVGEDGRYGYLWLNAYWTDPRRWAFFIRAGDKLAGFAMVFARCVSGEPGDYAMAEFCVLPKYRRQGVGQAAAHMLFGRFPGRWEIEYHPKNLPSAAFWQRTVAAYAGDAFRALAEVPGQTYPDGTPAAFLIFDSQK